MRLPPWTLAVVAVVFAGCQTIKEELPTQASGTGNPLATLAPGSITVLPVAIPSPVTPAVTTPSSPTPTATPTPAPAASATPAPAATPTPTPTSQQGPGPITQVRVGFFIVNCKPVGVENPRNGEKILPVGCIGSVTATPKDKNGGVVPAAVHGPDIEWELVDGHGNVEVRESIYEDDFNRDLVGRRPGSFSLCATVRTVTGCLEGNVVFP
jgi:hypothetical protein